MGRNKANYINFQEHGSRRFAGRRIDYS